MGTGWIEWGGVERGTRLLRHNMGLRVTRDHVPSILEPDLCGPGSHSDVKCDGSALVLRR